MPTLTADHDLLATRQAMGLTREAFADLLGVPLRTLEAWEQGRRQPSASALELLRALAESPLAVLRRRLHDGDLPGVLPDRDLAKLQRILREEERLQEQARELLGIPTPGAR